MSEVQPQTTASAGPTATSAGTHAGFVGRQSSAPKETFELSAAAMEILKNLGYKDISPKTAGLIKQIVNGNVEDLQQIAQLLNKAAQQAPAVSQKTAPDSTPSAAPDSAPKQTYKPG